MAIYVTQKKAPWEEHGILVQTYYESCQKHLSL